MSFVATLQRVLLENDDPDRWSGVPSTLRDSGVIPFCHVKLRLVAAAPMPG